MPDPLAPEPPEDSGKGRHYSADEILAAIHAALRARDFPAVSSLLHMLALKDPASAEAILAVVDASPVFGRPEGVE